MKYWKYYMAALIVILIDQAVKLIVHYNMEMGMPGEIVLLGDWLKLHYTLNPGMAFGVEIGSEYGKLILTLFRLVAMFGIGYYLYYLAKTRAPKGLIWCISLILGGAIGNLIDSTFYGVWFDNALYGSSTPWFHGQVIDMFYVDIWEGIIPHWVPLLGGKPMSLWPIFNVADSAIFVGVLIILFNQKRFFAHHDSDRSRPVPTGTVCIFIQSRYPRRRVLCTISSPCPLRRGTSPARVSCTSRYSWQV